MTQPTFIDLFAGCGGFSLGMLQAGYRPLWAIEIDADAVATYRRNIGHHIVCGDIAAIDVRDIPQPDVLIGGFPCQPFSISGLQDGFHGKDGDLFHHCVRFIDGLRPPIFVLENVPGFLQLQGGRFMRKAVETLEGLGYHLRYAVLDASEFGVPQIRKRLFLVGTRLAHDIEFPTPLASRPRSVYEAIDDIRLNMSEFLNNEPMKHTERIRRRFSAVRPGESAIDAMRRDPSLGTAKITKQCYRRLIADDPAPTIMANFVTTTIHYSEDRNLTAREAARIQSFPDDFNFCGRRTRMSWQTGLSQFEQIGNAVPPALAMALGNSLKETLHGTTRGIDKENSTRPFVGDQMSLLLPMDPSTVERRRGRRSQYAKIYKALEELPPGASLVLEDEVSAAFFVFLEGAMARRRIRYEVRRGTSESSVEIVRLP